MQNYFTEMTAASTAPPAGERGATEKFAHFVLASSSEHITTVYLFIFHHVVLSRRHLVVCGCSNSHDDGHETPAEGFTVDRSKNRVGHVSHRVH